MADLLSASTLRNAVLVPFSVALIATLVIGGATIASAQAASFGEATPISEGETVGSINGDSDFYTLEANDTDALDVSLTPQNGDLELTVYDQNRESIISDGFVPDGTTEQRIRKLPASGTYYIEVAANDDSTTATYTLNTTVVTPEENDDFAPNDEFESAVAIDDGFTDAKIWGGESDFYRLEANKTDALDVTLTPQGGDLELIVYDQNRESIASDGFVSAGDGDQVIKKLPADGTYYIEVAANDDSTTSGYRLNTAVVTPEENDDFAPNDEFESAAVIEEQFTDAKIWGGESDFYRLEANKTDALDVTLTPQGGDLELIVYDQNRESIASDGFVSAGDGDQVIKKLPANGTYYIEVAANDDSTTSAYTLNTVVVTPEENDDFAPNDGFASAAGVNQEIIDAKIWGGESDFYRLEANKTDALDVTLTPQGGDLEFIIYDQNRDSIASDGFVSVGDGDQIITKLPANGTYYIEVAASDDSTTSAYTLNTVVVTPSDNDNFAPNDGFESAAVIEEEFSDAKIWGGESDFYRVGLTAQDEWTVDLTTQQADMEFTIYSPDRTELASDSFVSDSDELSIVASQTGTYYVGVTTDGTETTDYTIQSTQTGDPNTPPTAAFTSDPVAPEAGEVVTFNASNSVDPDGSIASYSWDFDGDGEVDSTVETATTTYTYTGTGSYEAILTVADNSGAIATTDKSVAVQSNLAKADPQVALSDVQLRPSTVDSISSHTLEFTATNVSADGPGDASADEFEVTFPEEVVLEDYEVVSINTQYSAVEQNGNTLNFSVSPSGGETTQVSVNMSVTLSPATNN